MADLWKFNRYEQLVRDPSSRHLKSTVNNVEKKDDGNYFTFKTHTQTHTLLNTTT